MNRRRIGVLVWKEFLELRQTPQLFFLVLFAPVIQLVLLGYAATTDVRHVPIVVVDADRSHLSRRLIEQFAASPYFRIVADEAAPSDADAHLALGTAWLALVIPSGFQSALEQPNSTDRVDVQILADGSDANSSGVALAYAAGLVREFNGRLLAEKGQTTVSFDVRSRIWFNPELNSRHFMVPGVLAMLLLVVTANLSSMAIVREREIGTLEQLSVTPLTRWELMAGKLLPYGIIGFVDAIIVVLVTVFWFEVPLKGSALLLFGCVVPYLLCTLALGLFVSTVSQSQQQAMLTAIFFFLVPMIYLSGFTFPIENMPPAVQALTYAIPLRYFLVIVRGIFLKGVGLDVLWPQVAALFGWGTVMLLLAVMRARKRL